MMLKITWELLLEGLGGPYVMPEIEPGWPCARPKRRENEEQ